MSDAFLPTQGIERTESRDSSGTTTDGGSATGATNASTAKDPTNGERPRPRRKIDCAGNPEITDRQHIARGGRDVSDTRSAREAGEARRAQGARLHGAL